MYSLKQVSLLDQTQQRVAGAVFLAQKWKNDAVSVQSVCLQQKEDIILKEWHFPTSINTCALSEGANSESRCYPFLPPEG